MHKSLWSIAMQTQQTSVYLGVFQHLLSPLRKTHLHMVLHPQANPLGCKVLARLRLQVLCGYFVLSFKHCTQQFRCRLFNAAMLPMATIFPIYGMAQTAASAELIDVASFINGAYPYIPSGEKRQNLHSIEHVRHQLDGITHQGHSNDLFYISDGSNQKNLFYALAAPATIDSFRISGDNRDSHESMPRRFEFSVSQSPSQDFQTVAVFNTPDSYIFGRDRFYNFSIPAKIKITGRYVRVIVSGFKYNTFLNFNFNAYGRFNQPVQSRTDFSGIYHLNHYNSIVSQSDLDMVSRQKVTDYGPYLILHQKGMQISGCYVHGKYIIKSDRSGYFEVISDVIGHVTGRIENNVFRFTRISVKHLDKRRGAMALAPTGEGIGYPEIYGYFIVLRDSDSKDGIINNAYEEGFQSFGGSFFTPYADHANVTCAITGKVQFDSVYFNFDSRALTSESKAALDKVVDAAKAYPEWKFEISGHTDSIGSREYNQELSKQRAAAVVRYLVSRGVDVARLQAKGYGATPAFGGNGGHSINRRADVMQQ